MDRLALLEKVNDLLDCMAENYTEDCEPVLLSEYESTENKLLDFRNQLLAR
jgi:hypothetical protein